MKILDSILRVKNSDLDSLDTSYIKKYNICHDFSYFHGPSGKEHYRLLIYIASLYNNECLFDIGTYRGMSALALSNNPKNHIKTYDIKKCYPENLKIDNIEFILGDFTEDKNLIISQFIFLDALHDGIYENIVYKYLQKIKWKGLLLLDDIYLNDSMKEFWINITEKKYDISILGHWSGTGIVEFS